MKLYEFVYFLVVVVTALLLIINIEQSDRLDELENDVRAWEQATTYFEEVLNQRVPNCAEDVLIEGYGNFDAGQWEFYRCGPALDDYIGG